MTGTLRYKLQIALTTLKSYHWTEQEFLELWWKSWWFYEIINPRSSRTRTNYMKLNEVTNNYYVFCEQFQNIAWFLNVLFSRFKKPFASFSPKLSITYKNLVDYNCINRNETFIFSPCLITLEFRNPH